MAAAHPTFRFLVYVVAYEAERHLVDVFERIPRELFNQPDVHFLVNDDASADNGPLVLKQWLTERGIHNVTVLKNRVNQGYGGNQKIGFRVAVDGGYDCVILLHGDGQYAPELLPEFLKAWREEQPDVILGSRMHSTRSARAGGMPLYKLVGNRILTTFQNCLTGMNLEEYHTGYRAYSTSYLESVPFETNTNDFHFDTEILLQAAHVGASVREIHIPTCYGDEVCRVPGLKYAWNVVTATLQFKLHQWGMLCSLKLRNLSRDRYQDKTQVEYSSHALALRVLQRHGTQRVLDIGCGVGYVASRCEQAGMQVTGVDRSPPRPGTMSEFCNVDLEHDLLPVSISGFDAVLLLDVIEHLAHPEDFLLSLRNVDDADRHQRPAVQTECDPARHEGRRADAQGPLLVLSTPNVAFVAIRLNLLLGRFTYAERGILDITHKRLFTRRSLLRMLRDCGYDIERVHAVGVPFAAVMPGRTGRVLGTLANLLATLWPALFAFQVLVECRPRPGVDRVLKNAIRIHELAVSDCATVASGPDTRSSPAAALHRADHDAFPT